MVSIELTEDTTERIREYTERFERINLALEQIEDTIKISARRPIIDEAVWCEFGDIEEDICNIEEKLFDMNIKLYQLIKGKYEIKKTGRIGLFIRPIKN